MDERARRIGLNEAVFREVNEALGRVSTIGDRQMLDLVCECGRGECIDRIDVDPEEYERVRADGTLFFVIDGHEEPDLEDVVESRAAFNLVRKRDGDPALIARLTDPRR
jgi:hypothetical protein